MKPCNTIVEVDREDRILRLFKFDEAEELFEFEKRYEIAIGFYDGPGGEPDYKTPKGYFLVRDGAKVKDPSWTMPDSPWVAPENRGQVVPGGDPANPIVARWIGLADGVGIHGTRDKASIGTLASHGCIRMHKRDVIDLYDRVPIGSVVYVE